MGITGSQSSVAFTSGQIERDDMLQRQVTERERERNKKTDEQIINDQLFIEEGRKFLKERSGVPLPGQDRMLGYTDEDLANPQFVVDQLREHWRYRSVNEITLARDLYHLKTGTDEQKNRYFFLHDTIENDLRGKFNAETLKDYAGGIATAPSTWLSLLSGGKAKVGVATVMDATKRQILDLAEDGVKNLAFKKAKAKATVAGGATIGAIEGTAMAGQDVLRQKGEIEAGKGFVRHTIDPHLAANPDDHAVRQTREMLENREVDVEQAATVGVAGAALTGPLGAAAARKSFQRGADTAKGFDMRSIRGAANAKLAAQETDNVFGDAVLGQSAKEIETQILSLEAAKKKALDKTLVAAGQRVKGTIMDTLMRKKSKDGPEFVDETGQAAKQIELTADMTPETVRNIAAASAKIVSRLPKIKGERITQTLARAIQGEDDALNVADMVRIMDEHNITQGDIGKFLMADLHDAASKLGTMSALKRKLVNETMDGLAQLESVGMRTVTQEQKRFAARENSAYHKGIWQFMTNVDKLRLGSMTSQLATTVRNTQNATMRTAIYALDNFIEAGIDGTGNWVKRALGASEEAAPRVGINNPFRIYKELVNPAEAEIIKRIFSEEMPGNFQQLFRANADLAENFGVGSSIAELGKKMNYINTLSDNTFKRAVFTDQMKQNYIKYTTKADRDKYGATFIDFLKNGHTMNSLDPMLIKNSLDETMSFVYQKGYADRKTVAGKFANNFIKVFSQPGASIIMPFPKFTMNSLEFMYTHAPIIGMADFLRPGVKRTTGDILSKQVTGMGMLYGALLMRSRAGDENTGPFEYYTAGGIIDTRAQLGPFGVFSWAADQIYRFANQKENEGLANQLEKIGIPKNEDITFTKVDYENLAKAVMGTTLRTGTGLQFLDKSIEYVANNREMQDKDFKFLRKLTGDWLNTFTIPAGMLKDLNAQFNPQDYAIVPDNNDVNGWQYFAKQAARSFPHVTDPMNGYLSYSRDKGATGNKWLFGFDVEDVGPRKRPMTTPTKGGGFTQGDKTFVTDPLYARFPWEKQLLGLTHRNLPNALESEAKRLQIEHYEMYQGTGDAEIDWWGKMYTGQLNSESALPLVKSEAYKKLSNEKKIVELKSLLALNAREGKARALAKVQSDSDMAGEPFSRGEIFEYNRIPKDVRRLIDSEYKKETGSSVTDGGGYRRALEMYNDFKREKGQLFSQGTRRGYKFLEGRSDRGIMSDPYRRGTPRRMDPSNLK